MGADRLRLEEQPAGGEAARDTSLRSIPERIPSGLADTISSIMRLCLARVARDFGHALLVVVQFLQGHDRHVDVVLLEAVEARGVVHQHVGIEDKQL